MSSRSSAHFADPRGGSWRPDPTEELLLEAAVAHGPPALDAWCRWAAGGRLDWTEPDDHRVLPSVYLNLVAAADVPHAGRLKGVYRHAWYGNQILIPPAAKLLEQLGAERVPAL